MNIFKKFNENQDTDKSLPTDPNDLFYSLKKEKEYSYLRGIQEEVLAAWNDRREEDDLLIKMNTGAGKTLIGLLALYSKMLETKGRSIYLCPDKQLVQQVFDQSQHYNIPTCIIEEDNEFPEKFLNNESILITTVQKLFNGKNIFDKNRIDIDSIVIDDAHRCAEKVKDSFSIKFTDNHEVYKELFNLFAEELKRQAPGAYQAINTKQADYFLKLPFWSWLDNKQQVLEIFTPYIGELESLLFKWDLFHNNYEQYELFISSSKIEISPIKCYIENIPTYVNAKHKYALSATFENDISLLFDLNFSKNSVENPIEPKDRKDYGQRLILTPKRYFDDFKLEDMVNIIEHHKKNQNIMVLVPSYKEAINWEGIGARIINENIEDEISKLKKSKGNFVVLVNRYDGIDLGGGACNVLVIHEHPKYKFLKDRYFENLMHTTNTNLIAQTIEQGMGRTVRSGNDFSVIYLTGKNILRFLRHKENFKYLNKHTRKQIEMGMDLLSQDEVGKDKKYSKILTETADFCLMQNDEWIKYYRQYMSSKDSSVKEIDKSRYFTIKILEKEAIQNWMSGKNDEAIRQVREILGLDLDDSEMALYYQLLANIYYGIDSNTSNDLILKSREISRHMFEPFLATEFSKRQLKTENQFAKALKHLQSYSTMNDAIHSCNEILARLKFDPSNDSNFFEEAIKGLGLFLGCISIRPEKEKNEGPDNLWVLGNDKSMIMEAKSEKLHKNLISKSDISQLMHSVTWFENRYLSVNVDCLAVTLQPNKKKENDVEVNEKFKVIDLESLNGIREAFSKYIKFLAQNDINILTPEKIKTEFVKLNFTSDLFIQKYLKKIL